MFFFFFAHPVYTNIIKCTHLCLSYGCLLLSSHHNDDNISYYLIFALNNFLYTFVFIYLLHTSIAYILLCTDIEREKAHNERERNKEKEEKDER